MKAKKWGIIGLVGLVLGIFFWQSVGARSELDSETFEPYKRVQCERLRGLQGIGLIILGPPAPLKRYGLSKTQIETDVELKLRQAGIRILSSEELDKTVGYPVLVVWAHAEIRDRAVQVRVLVEFKENVLLFRDPNVSFHGTTWTTYSTGPGFGVMPRVMSIEDVQDIRGLVKDDVDQFINDYLAANPQAADDSQLIKGTGTIRYAEVEGGFYAIHADGGESYDPINLPSSYAKDGIRVKFTVRYRPDMVSIHMSGKIVEIIKIERQED